MFKYVIGVNVGEQIFFKEFLHEKTALDVFDSIAEQTDAEIENNFLEVAGNATVSKVSIRRVPLNRPIGNPNR